MRYLAALWIGCKFKASSLQVAGFDCTWVAAQCLKIMVPYRAQRRVILMVRSKAVLPNPSGESSFAPMHTEQERCHNHAQETYWFLRGCS